MAKAGKELEQLVKVIQETTKGFHNTTIETNVKMDDVIGIKREIDVLVEDRSKSPFYRIAFECKDYKNKVDVQIVDGVIGKFIDIPSINKIIIVTSKGYTVSAKKKAQKHNIELSTLSKIPLNKILIKSIPILTTSMKTEVLDIYFELDNSASDIIHISETKENINYYLYLFKSNPPIYDNIKLCELGDRFASNNLNPIRDILVLESLGPKYIYGITGEKIKLKNVLFEVKISINTIEGKIQEQRITKDDSNEFITAKYKMNDTYSMVTIQTPNKTSTYIETEDKQLHKPQIY